MLKLKYSFSHIMALTQPFEMLIKYRFIIVFKFFFFINPHLLIFLTQQHLTVKILTAVVILADKFRNLGYVDFKRRFTRITDHCIQIILRVFRSYKGANTCASTTLLVATYVQATMAGSVQLNFFVLQTQNYKHAIKRLKYWINCARNYNYCLP